MQKRVLVVDDNDVIRTIVRSAIEMHTPYIVQEASDGVDAVEKAETLNPDLVVMDLSLPRMNGLAATRVLKRSQPPVQVALFTLHKGVVSDFEAQSAGLSAVVAKSEGLETLLREVQHLLQTTHRSEERRVGKE